MIKVLFVCLGNICRSPLAEGIFLKQVNDQGWGNKFLVDSAGTASYHIGSLADKRSIHVAQFNNIKLTHKARAFTANDFEHFDYIVAMDKQNFKDIERKRPLNSQTKVLLMRDYDKEGKAGDVPDPYYGEHKDFENVYDILYRSCESLLNELSTAKKQLNNE